MAGIEGVALEVRAVEELVFGRDIGEVEATLAHAHVRAAHEAASFHGNAL